METIVYINIIRVFGTYNLRIKTRTMESTLYSRILHYRIDSNAPLLMADQHVIVGSFLLVIHSMGYAIMT